MMIQNIACSADCHSSSAAEYVRRVTENPNDTHARSMLDFYESHRHAELTRIITPEWQEMNLEYDLRSTGWILEKVKDDRYAQNLYAALCNNSFRNLHIIELLKESEWGCSWRHAGSIVSNMREHGDYMDWYCSGIGDGLGNGDADNKLGYVSESTVTDVIRVDLERLGWLVLPTGHNEF